MRERFALDQQQNILFINFAGLRIESREQVDEMEEIVEGVYSRHGRRFYAVVNYEGAEIAPEIIDYYGFFNVVKPLRRLESFARRLVIGGAIEPLDVTSRDEVGRMALALDETAKQLRRDIERLSGLYHISLLIGAGAEVSRVGELLTRKVARLLDAEMCVILLYDEDERSIHAQLPGYGVSDEQLRLLRSKLEGKTIAERVIKTGEPYVTNDAANDPLINRAAANLLAVRELLAVPLQAGERTLGALEVMNRPGGFLEEDRQIVTIFASQAAQLLANAQLLEKERRMAQHLIASERLAAVGELVAGVAHEVRNPLFGITTTLSALSRKLEDREAARPFLDVINTEVDRLNHLMEQLLEHGSPVRISAEVADIRELIHETMAEFKAQAEAKGVALVCDCAAPAPGLRLDRRKMRGVFANLLDNAIQHTEANGQIRVAVSESKSEANGVRRLQIEVSDTGSGIAPEDIGRVFDPFFTTRARGIGLGLAITRKTIHDHGGSITVMSEQGKGASFIIELPLD
jgi:signal transduction histidine kinase/HAMP domain-containing protein